MSFTFVCSRCAEYEAMLNTTELLRQREIQHSREVEAQLAAAKARVANIRHIIETEPELEGEPEQYLVERMREIGLVETMRATVRTTKQCILKRIDQHWLAAEPTPDSGKEG